MTSYANDERFPGPDPYAPLPALPSFTLASKDFSDGDQLEDRFAGDDGLSPELHFSDLPEGTKSLAVTCLDPDAPTAAGFWHWAVLNIPVSTSSLPTGAGEHADLGLGGDVITLANDFGDHKYAGAAPPEGHGPHRYLFVVHAVDVEKLDLDESATPTVLGFNLFFHGIGRAVTWAWYEA